MKYKKGCLIEAAQKGEVNIIAHCCNCFRTFGSGVALAIKKAFPEAYRADLATPYAAKEKLGTFSKTSPEKGCPIIFNLYGQYRCGNDKVHVDYEALQNALFSMSFYLCKEDRIGIPKLGAGLAGGNWAIIEKIVERSLGHLDVTVYEL